MYKVYQQREKEKTQRHFENTALTVLMAYVLSQFAKAFINWIG